MTPPRLLTALLAVLLICLPASAQDDPATSLRPAWTTGQATQYDFWSKSQKTETAELFGQTRSETTTYLTEGRMNWTVEQVNDDGTSVCKMKMAKIKFTISAGENEPVVVDSENPSGDQPVFDQLIAAMVGTTLTVHVKADGSIEKVEGVQDMADAAGKEAVEAEIVPEELDFMQNASELATLVAAPAQATPGQTWNTRHTWNQDNVLPGAKAKADWDTTYTFASLGQIAGVPIATIKTDSKIDIKVDLAELTKDAPPGAQVPDIDLQISNAKAAGEVLFDLSRHEAVARNESMSYTADVTVTPPNDRVPPIKVKITQKSQSQLLRVAEE